MTGQDYIELAQAGPPTGPPPDWIESAGGVGVLFPGGSGVSTVNLEEGNYALVCFVEGHFLQGMISPLTVTAAGDVTRAQPNANATIVISDSGYVLSGTITPGVNTIQVNNDGEKEHEAQLIQLAPEVSVEDLFAIFGGEEPEGPPSPGGLPFACN